LDYPWQLRSVAMGGAVYNHKMSHGVGRPKEEAFGEQSLAPPAPTAFRKKKRSRDMTRKRKGGLMSPLARRALYSSALFRRASKELRIVSAITPADL